MGCRGWGSVSSRLLHTFVTPKQPSQRTGRSAWNSSGPPTWRFVAGRSKAWTCKTENPRSNRRPQTRILFSGVTVGATLLGREGNCLLVVENNDVASPAPSTPGSHRPGDARPGCTRCIWHLHFRASSWRTPGSPCGFASQKLRRPRGERQGERSRIRCYVRRGEASVGWALSAPRRQTDRQGSQQNARPGLGKRGG